MRVDIPPSSVVDIDSNNGDSLVDDDNDIAPKDVPNALADDYFRGFFAFALWGYIPPEGGENFKSSLIGTIVDTGSKIKKENGRAVIRETKSIEKQHDKDCASRAVGRDVTRGLSRGVKENNDQLGELGNILIKGRKEMAKQKLFKCRIDKIEFQLKYYTSRIKEIQDEVNELRMYGDSDDEAMSELRKELKEARKDKKEAFEKWSVITDAEEGQRTVIDMNDDNEDGVVTVEPYVECMQSIETDSSLTESVQCCTSSSTVKGNPK